MNPLFGRHLLTLLDFEPYEIQFLLDLAIGLKRRNMLVKQLLSS